MAETPHIGLVPKDVSKNAKYRRWIIDLGATDRRMAKAIQQACKQDILFWVNSFCFTLDPRKKQPVIPFITYGFQDEALSDLVDAIRDGHDVAIEKSRDMGASWMMC